MRYQVAAEIRADLKRLRRETDSSGRVTPAAARKCPQAWPCRFRARPLQWRFACLRRRVRAERVQFGGDASGGAAQNRHGFNGLVLLALVAAAAFGIYSFLSRDKSVGVRSFYGDAGDGDGQSLACGDIARRELHSERAARWRAGKLVAAQRAHQQQHADRSAFGRSYTAALRFSPDGNSIYFVRAMKRPRKTCIVCTARRCWVVAPNASSTISAATSAFRPTGPHRVHALQAQRRRR